MQGQVSAYNLKSKADIIIMWLAMVETRETHARPNIIIMWLVMVETWETHGRTSICLLLKF